MGKRNARVFLSFVLIMTLIIGAGTGDVSAATKKPSKIYTKASVKYIDYGAKAKVTVYKAKPSKASKSSTWKITSGSKYAKLTNKKNTSVYVSGKNKSTKAKKIKIRATSKSNKNAKAYQTVIVKNMKAAGLSLNYKKRRTSTLGSACTMKAKVKAPANTAYKKQKTKWKSSNTSVATVKASGTYGYTCKVSLKKAGTTTITATNDGKKATCKLTVKPREIKPDKGVYTIDKKYTKVKLEGKQENDPSISSIVIGTSDINNLFGTNKSQPNIWDAKSMKEKYAKANFSYEASRKDGEKTGTYEFTKKDKKLYVDFYDKDGEYKPTEWNYQSNSSSFDTKNNGYTLKYGMQGNLSRVQDITMKTKSGESTISVDVRGKKIDLTRNSKGTIITLKVDKKTRAKVQKNSDGSYKLTISKAADINKLNYKMYGYAVK